MESNNRSYRVIFKSHISEIRANAITRKQSALTDAIYDEIVKHKEAIASGVIYNDDDLASSLAHAISDFSKRNKRSEDRNVFDLLDALSELNPLDFHPRAGLYVVIGRTARGKSRWLREFLNNPLASEKAVLLNHDEPSLVTDDFGMSRGMHELIQCVNLIAEDRTVSVIALDGVRTIQYESKGNTLTGGVNSDFFRFLTDAGNVAVQQGLILLFTYNPNTEKSETFEMVRAMVEGSIQGVIDLDNSVIKSRYARREAISIANAADVIFGSFGGDSYADDSNAQSEFDKTEI